MRNLTLPKTLHPTTQTIGDFSTLACNSTMAGSDAQGLLSSLMAPSLSTILITALIALTIPILLHFTLYLSATKTHLPTFLLIGPRGSGKTSLITLVRATKPLSFLCSRLTTRPPPSSNAATPPQHTPRRRPYPSNSPCPSPRLPPPLRATAPPRTPPTKYTSASC